MSEKIPPPEKSVPPEPTAMEIAFAEAIQKNGGKGIDTERTDAEAQFGADVGEELHRLLPQVTKPVKVKSSRATIEAAPAPVVEVPAELREIFGERNPPKGAVELLGKLKGKKREGYLQKLAEDEAERLKKRGTNEKKQKKQKRKPAENKKGTESSAVVTEVVPVAGHDETIAPVSDAPKQPPFSLNDLDPRRADRVDDLLAQLIPNGEFVEGKSVAISQEDVPRYISERLAEDTPKGWRAKLREMTETVKWWASSREELVRRNKELDEEAEKMGGMTEKIFRAIGTGYNKLGWKSKLLVGASLGIGAGVAASFSAPAALAACLGGVGLQRIAAFSTMYLKFEKASIEKNGLENDKETGFWKWGQKEKAMMKAILYTAAMTGGTIYAVQEIRDHEIPQKIQAWLGDMLGYGTSEEVGGTIDHPTESSPAITTEISPEVEAQLTAANEAPLQRDALGSIDITAQKGQGYEGMLKKLAEELQGKEIPADLDTKSDLYALAHSDNLNKTVHELALKHGMVSTDGVSAKIGLGSHLSIGADGHLNFENTIHTPAPVEVPVTQATSTGSISAPVGAPTSAAAYESFYQNVSPDGTESNLYHGNPAEAGDALTLPPPAEAPAPAVQDSLPVQEIAPVPRVETVIAPEHIAQSITSSSGIKVSMTDSGIYKSMDGRLYGFGGTDPDDLAQAYASKNHFSVFLDKSYKLFGFIDMPRTVEYTPDGKMVIHNGGAALVSDPKTFTARVDK